MFFVWGHSLASIIKWLNSVARLILWSRAPLHQVHWSLNVGLAPAWGWTILLKKIDYHKFGVSLDLHMGGMFAWRASEHHENGAESITPKTYVKLCGPQHIACAGLG